MKRGPKPGPATIAARMQPLPRRHRVAHLRALVRREPFGSARGEQLAALLRDEMTAQPRHENRDV